MVTMDLGQEGAPQTFDVIDEFLLRCLRARFDEEALDEARTWFSRSALAWEQVTQRTQKESITPLIYSLLRGQTWLPQEVEERWHQIYMHNAMRNLLLLVELAHIIRVLAGAGVPTIVLKGGALMENVYGNVALRPMRDMDLLVHRDLAPAAMASVESLGYAPSHPEEYPGMVFAYENEIALCKADRESMPLELHWSLFDTPYYQQHLPMDWFWRTATPALFEDAAALILGPEAQVLHLSAHLMLHHRGKGLRWLHDVAEVVHRYQSSIDWELLLDRACRYQLALPLQKVLPLVARRWRAPIPSETLVRLDTLLPSPDERRIYRQMTTPHRSVAQRFWADLSDISGRRQQFRFLRRKLFPSTAYMRQRYGVDSHRITIFSYPYRWWLGIWSIFYRKFQTRGQVKNNDDIER